MKTSNAVVWLSALVGMLALVATGLGLFWQDGGSAFTFTPLRGGTVQIYGQGLYHYDTLFAGANYKGQDAVTLVIALPLLMRTILRYRRGSLPDGLLLMGILAYFFYVYASMALGAAYNRLFLVYIALFSASFFAFILAFTGIDQPTLSTHLATRLRHRLLAIFMFVCGLLTLVVWLAPLLSSLSQDQPPKLLGSYTTSITDVLDLGIIVPATFISGSLLLRRHPLGYLTTFSLLTIIGFLLPVIMAGTVSQLTAGISFTPGEIIGPITGFLVLGLLAIWIMVIFLRHLAEPTLLQPAHVG